MNFARIVLFGDLANAGSISTTKQLDAFLRGSVPKDFFVYNFGTLTHDDFRFSIQIIMVMAVYPYSSTLLWESTFLGQVDTYTSSWELKSA